MVVYDLLCNKNHRFEGWFPSFEAYQDQAAQRLISCPTCGSTAVEKLPHACAVHTRKEEKKEQERTEKTPPTQLSEAEMREALIRLHHYVRQNFEDVGPRFAEEARQIFHGKAEARPIHGTSSSEETKELDEEGVPYTILPKPDLDS